jgi:hypothetical protein
MTMEEARKAIDTVMKDAEEIAALVLALHDREGWKALGYDSFHACMQKELGITRVRAYQLLEGAKINAILMLPDASTPAIPSPLKESHARALSPLKHNPAVLRKTAAEVRSGKDKPTASDFREGVSRVLGVPKPSSGRRPSSRVDGGDYVDIERYRCADCGEQVSDPHDCMNVGLCNGQCPACCRP